VASYAEAWASDPVPVADLALQLLAEGVHMLERGLLFVSTAHGDDEIEETVAAARRALDRLAGQ
jgi:glutamate-1-semialdehyde aminotransferase